MAEPVSQGLAAVKAAFTSAQQQAQVREPRVPDPPPGSPRDGVLPGDWRSPERPFDRMPPDCPVRVLGMDGKNLYIITTLGQLDAVAPNSFGQAEIQSWFGARQGYITWAWPRMGKPKKDGDPPAVTGFDMVRARSDFYAEAERRGLWRAVDKVRGRGAWRGEDGSLIFHCGKYLWKRGQLMLPGEIEGYLYPACPQIPAPFAEPVPHAHNPAPELYRLLTSWNWRRDKVAALLVLGWIGAAMLGGALRWRPSIFVVGDKAVGKSTLQNLVCSIFEPAILHATDTTPAGLYQTIGMDALPVAVDELENEAQAQKVKEIVRLARLAASGGVRYRGGADHSAIQFQSRSCYLFAAINPPAMSAADRSRLGMLQLDKIKPRAEGERERPNLKAFDSLGPKLMRRLADAWDNFELTLEAYREALSLGGHDDRGQDQYGTLLACAHALMGDEGMEEAGWPIEDLSQWGEWLSTAGMEEHSENEENWYLCVRHLLTVRIDVWRGGSRTSIGQVIEAMKEGLVDGGPARELLEQAGVRLVTEKDFRAAKPPLRSWGLAVPNAGPGIGLVFKDTSWAGGVWSSALRQGPPDVILVDPAYNRVRIAGVQQRSTIIDLKRFDELAGAEGEA